MKIFRDKLRDQRGFNLIELMIVIAIIGLLIGVGSIAWGAMIRSGNETATAQQLDRIRTYQAQYAANHRGKFATFEQLVASSGLDGKFSGDRPIVNGYEYELTVEEASTEKPAFYKIKAKPQVATGVTATGTRYFYTDSSLGTIKASDQGEANEQSDSL